MASLYSKVRELVSGLGPRDDSDLYQALFDSAAAGMVTIDQWGAIQACNPALCQLFGYQAEELLGRGIECLMPDSFARQHQLHIEQYVKTGQASVMGRGREVTAQHKSGRQFPVQLSVSEMRFDGRLCFTGVVHDLSDSAARLPEQLRDQSWLANVIDHTPLAVTVKDVDGRYLLMNRQAEVLLDTRADLAAGKTDAELFDGHWAGMETRTDLEICRARQARLFVQPLNIKGHSRPLLINKSLLADSGQRPMGVVSLIQDISTLHPRNRSNAGKLNLSSYSNHPNHPNDSNHPNHPSHHNNSNAVDMLDLLPQALAFVALDGAILSGNQAYAQRFGMSSHALQDCNLTVIETDAVARAFHQLLAGDRRETRVTEADQTRLRLQKQQWQGEELVVLFAEAPNALASDDADQPQQQLHQDRGRSASHSLTDNSHFIASLSHELRTPLNSVIGFSQILRASDIAADQLEAVGMIERAGKHLVALVDQVMDLIKLDGSVSDISEEAFALEPVIEECIELASPLEFQHKIHIDYHCQLEQPWLMGDRVRVKQILLNLLTNAIKYNRADKTVEIRVEQYSPGQIRINVRDEGHGIDDDQRHKVFMPFERLGAEHSAVEGSGLGLAICRQLAERMQGSLDFHSIPGQGSTFWLQMPATAALYQRQPVARANEPTQDFAIDAACRVLYIEDNYINARFVELGLKSHQHVDVMLAHTGQQGMDLALQQKPDVILLDMRLPDMHGLDLLKKLRAIPELRNAKIVGVSAEALPSHIRDSDQPGADGNMGLDGYMMKPVDLQELNEVILH